MLQRVQTNRWKWKGFSDQRVRGHHLRAISEEWRLLQEGTWGNSENRFDGEEGRGEKRDMKKNVGKRESVVDKVQA